MFDHFERRGWRRTLGNLDATALAVTSAISIAIGAGLVVVARWRASHPDPEAFIDVEAAFVVYVCALLGQAFIFAGAITAAVAVAVCLARMRINR